MRLEVEPSLYAELERIERELRELIERHSSPTGQHPVAVAELQNIVEPGSAPMYPNETGWVATCSICLPDGDGVNFRRGRR